jgi:uncharacterized RDD family membrane protein YckC
MSTARAIAQPSRRYTPAKSSARRRAPAAGAEPDRPPVAAAWRRVGAALLDALVPAVVVIAGADLAWAAGLLRLAGVSDAGWVAWSWSFHRVAWTVAAAAFAYQAVCVGRWQATPGKRALGLRVARSDGGRPGWRTALWRAAWPAAVFVPTFISPLVLAAGWMVVADGQRRSLGDHAAGTLVQRSPRTPPA